MMHGDKCIISFICYGKSSYVISLLSIYLRMVQCDRRNQTDDRRRVERADAIPMPNGGVKKRFLVLLRFHAEWWSVDVGRQSTLEGLRNNVARVETIVARLCCLWIGGGN